MRAYIHIAYVYVCPMYACVHAYMYVRTLCSNVSTAGEDSVAEHYSAHVKIYIMLASIKSSASNYLSNVRISEAAISSYVLGCIYTIPALQKTLQG